MAKLSPLLLLLSLHSVLLLLLLPHFHGIFTIAAAASYSGIADGSEQWGYDEVRPSIVEVRGSDCIHNITGGCNKGDINCRVTCVKLFGAGFERAYCKLHAVPHEEVFICQCWYKC